MNIYRIWPDGTVQEVSDGPAYTHMSDDYRIVRAEDEDSALLLALGDEPPNVASK